MLASPYGAYGGDPVLFQHVFWLYSHPAIYIMSLLTGGGLWLWKCRSSI